MSGIILKYNLYEGDSQDPNMEGIPFLHIIPAKEKEKSQIVLPLPLQPGEVQS